MDPYRTLGVSKGCNREDVKEAFRLRVQHVHPDHGGEDLSFIRLRMAYEQILAELDEEAVPDFVDRKAEPRAGRYPEGMSSRSVGGSYETWFRHVAVQADRRQPAWRSPRMRTIGLTIVVGFIAVNLAALLIIWSREPLPRGGIPVVPAERLEEPDAATPIRIVTGPVGQRRWQRPPAYPPDFFVIPYNAELYLAPARGLRGDSTEFGVVDPQGNPLPIFTGMPGHPNPAGEVDIGPVVKGSKLRIYLKKNGTWVFSDAASSRPSKESFWDRDNSLGGNGSVIEQTGGATWLLHLDDVDSTDDDDADIYIQVRLGPIGD